MTAACVLCEWAPTNTAALLWDPADDTHYCANPTACGARQ